MKRPSRSRSLTRSLMASFGAKRPLSTYKRHPDAYYRHIYLDKPMFDGIQLVAKIEHLSKKKAASLLIQRGFINYISEKPKEAIKVEIAAEELRRKPKTTRFALELR